MGYWSAGRPRTWQEGTKYFWFYSKFLLTSRGWKSKKFYYIHYWSRFSFFLPVIGSAAPIITIRPMITVGGRLDSNFYKTENNEREVYTYFLRPGIQLGIQTAKSKINFNYTLDAYFYDDKSVVPVGEHPADDENYVGHYAVLDARCPPHRSFNRGIEWFLL